MSGTFLTMGAIAGFLIAVILIFLKLPPWLSLTAGALMGGLLGGGTLAETGQAMLGGAWDMLPTIARILSSGVLAGALVVTGAAERISQWVMDGLGQRWAAASIALCAMVLCAVGVFVDITVITAAPIAMAIGKKAGFSPKAILLALIGGGKAGNIISPNPNTIAVAQSFGVELTSLMAKNILPALCGLAMTLLLVCAMKKEPSAKEGAAAPRENLPGLGAAIAGPAAVILLLMLRPVCGIVIDPLFALPAGGILCVFAAGSGRQLGRAVAYGLEQVAGVAFLLLGTGCLAGILLASRMQNDLLRGLEQLHFPLILLAPLSGILLSGAAASTTAGAAIASRAFGAALVTGGLPPLHAAAMIHAGAVTLDSLPHGSFFHTTAGSAGLSFRQRISLLPAEALIGFACTAACTLFCQIA